MRNPNPSINKNNHIKNLSHIFSLPSLGNLMYPLNVNVYLFICLGVCEKGTRQF